MTETQTRIQYLPIQQISFRESAQEVRCGQILEQYEDWPTELTIRANVGRWCWTEVLEAFLFLDRLE